MKMLKYFIIDYFTYNFEVLMKIPCTKYITFVVSGFAFLKLELSNIQFQNLTLIASAIILGSKLDLS